MDQETRSKLRPRFETAIRQYSHYKTNPREITQLIKPLLSLLMEKDIVNSYILSFLRDGRKDHYKALKLFTSGKNTTKIAKQLNLEVEIVDKWIYGDPVNRMQNPGFLNTIFNQFTGIVDNYCPFCRDKDHRKGGSSAPSPLVGNPCPCRELEYEKDRDQYAVANGANLDNMEY